MIKASDLINNEFEDNILRDKIEEIRSELNEMIEQEYSNSKKILTEKILGKSNELDLLITQYYRNNKN